MLCIGIDSFFGLRNVCFWPLRRIWSELQNNKEDLEKSKQKLLILFARDNYVIKWAVPIEQQGAFVRSQMGKLASAEHMNQETILTHLKDCYLKSDMISKRYKVEGLLLSTNSFLWLNFEWCYYLSLWYKSQLLC